MRLFDLLYGRMGGNQQPQQFQAPQMSTPTPPQPYGDPNSAGGQFSTGRSWMTAPNMSAPQPPQQFQPFTAPRMSQPTPPQAFGQFPRMPDQSRRGWNGRGWGFEP